MGFRTLEEGMRLMHRKQSGLTLLELLIALALTGVLTAGVSMAIGQVFTGTTRSSNHMVAIRQVQEAGYWVQFYAYMAQDMTVTGQAGFPLVLRWVDFGTGQRHKVEFRLDESGLRGSYYVDDVFDAARSAKIPVFLLVDRDKTKTNCKVAGGSSFSLPDNGDAFTITGGDTADSGVITVTQGSISVSVTGSATYNPSTGAWTTTGPSDTVRVAAASAGTTGSWTSETTKAAVAAITTDSGAQAATLYGKCKTLVFTVTATVGTGRLQASETRVYKVVPKPVS